MYQLVQWRGVKDRERERKSEKQVVIEFDRCLFGNQAPQTKLQSKHGNWHLLKVYTEMCFFTRERVGAAVCQWSSPLGDVREKVRVDKEILAHVTSGIAGCTQLPEEQLYTKTSALSQHWTSCTYHDQHTSTVASTTAVVSCAIHYPTSWL